MFFVFVGSKNPQKVAAVKEEFSLVRDIDHFGHCDADSGISEQPESLEEIRLGAMNRAREAVRGEPVSPDIRLGVGLESGIIGSLRPDETAFDVTVCAIYLHSRISSPVPGEDIEEWIYGMSSGFTLPEPILRHVRKGHDLSQASRLAGYTDHPKVGEAEGILGILSKGRTTRKDQLREAVRMALIHIDTLL